MEVRVHQTLEWNFGVMPVPVRWSAAWYTLWDLESDIGLGSHEQSQLATSLGCASEILAKAASFGEVGVPT